MALSIDTLKTVPLLASLKDKELDNLARSMRERQYEAGEAVVQEGTGGIGFFMILDGSAEVSVRGEHRATLRAGEFFGELGLLDDRVGRLATVRAAGNLRTVAMTSWEFRVFVREHPDVAWTLLCTMASRVGANERHSAQTTGA